MDKNELKALLDNPRTGLRQSSSTNKVRSAILAAFDELQEPAPAKFQDIERHGRLNNMGKASFEINLEPNEVQLVIHGHAVAARTQANVYEELFNHCKFVIETTK